MEGMVEEEEVYNSWRSGRPAKVSGIVPVMFAVASLLQMRNSSKKREKTNEKRR